MTEPDIIRMGGVEYEHIPHDRSPAAYLGERWIAIRPKRKQTGTICECVHSQCVCVAKQGTPPLFVPYCAGSQATRPFYGKVVEE